MSDENMKRKQSNSNECEVKSSHEPVCNKNGSATTKLQRIKAMSKTKKMYIHLL